MTKLFYFKATFLIVASGLFAGLVVYGLFDVHFDTASLLRLVGKSLAMAVILGAISGIINMYLRIGSFPNKK